MLFQLAYVLLQSLWTILFLTFPHIIGGSFRVLYPIWVFGMFFCLAGHFSVAPNATSRIFGTLNLATIYGIIYVTTVRNFRWRNLRISSC